MEEKHRGLVRRVDSLGRVVIPKEVRLALHIANGDMMEFYVTTDSVVVKKYYLLDSLERFLPSLIKLVGGKSIFIFDTDNLICTNERIVKQEMTTDLKNIMQNREECKLEDIEVVSGINLINAEFFPVISNGDLIGAIVSEDAKVGKDLQMFLTSYLDN